MGAIELIKSDLFRYAGTTSSKAFIKTYVKEAGFRFSVAFRLVNAGGENCWEQSYGNWEITSRFRYFEKRKLDMDYILAMEGLLLLTLQQLLEVIVIFLNL